MNQVSQIADNENIISYRNEEWAKDLENNQIKASGMMRDPEGGRCCLAVAEDAAVRMGYLGVTSIDCNGIRLNTAPSIALAQFFGWCDPTSAIGYILYTPMLKEGSACLVSAATLNDDDKMGGRGCSHVHIAEYVRRTFCVSVQSTEDDLPAFETSDYDTADCEDFLALWAFLGHESPYDVESEFRLFNEVRTIKRSGWAASFDKCTLDDLEKCKGFQLLDHKGVMGSLLFPIKDWARSIAKFQ